MKMAHFSSGRIGFAKDIPKKKENTTTTTTPSETTNESNNKEQKTNDAKAQDKK